MIKQVGHFALLSHNIYISADMLTLTMLRMRVGQECLLGE